MCTGLRKIALIPNINLVLILLDKNSLSLVFILDFFFTNLKKGKLLMTLTFHCTLKTTCLKKNVT